MMEQFKKNHTYIAAGVLIILGLLFRTVWHLGDNVEFVTSAALLSGVYLGFGWSVLVPLGIMIISDIYLGNTNIFFFTWSAYLFIALFAYKAIKVQRSKTKIQNQKIGFNTIVQSTCLGFGASVFFYLWTNFGVWFLDSWDMYPKTLAGLIDAYILGLPFLKSNLIGNSILVPVSFFTAEGIRLFVFQPSRKSHKVVKNTV